MSTCVETIPVLNDNWVYLVESQTSGDCLLIDAGEAAPVLKALNGRELKHILLTHHHGDHIHGAADIQKQTRCYMNGAKADLARLPRGTEPLPEVWGWEEYEFEVVESPGHTVGHVMFYEKNNHWLFSGDTLFIAGCGRLFEGSHEQMFNTLQRIKELPNDTKIFCGHDYTKASLTFAAHLFPYNKDILEALTLAEKNIHPKITTLATEKKINPFLKAETLEEFKEFRIMKDNF